MFWRNNKADSASLEPKGSASVPYPSIHPTIQPLYKITGPFKGYPRQVADHPIIFTFTFSRFYFIHPSRAYPQSFKIRQSALPCPPVRPSDEPVFTKFRYEWQMGRDSTVGIETGYRLDGPGIESRWMRDFPHLSRPALGPHPAPYTKGTESLSRG